MAKRRRKPIRAADHATAIVVAGWLAVALIMGAILATILDRF